MYRIMFTIGRYSSRYSACIGWDIGRYSLKGISVECRPSVGWVSEKCRSSVDTANSLTIDTYQPIQTNYRPLYRHDIVVDTWYVSIEILADIVSILNMNCWPIIGEVLSVIN